MERRDLFARCSPDYVGVDVEVSVDEPVPHPDDGCPRNGRHRRLSLVGHLAGGFTDHFNRVEHREEKQTVSVEVVTLLSVDELLHCLGGVDHVQDSDAIVIAHTELAKTESPLP